MRSTKSERRNTKYGFTLVELLVALSVSSIILGAVAALAFAATSANDATNEAARVNTELRTATLRITELIAHAKLIAGTPAGDIVIWARDNGANSNKIDADELVFIETTANKVKLVTYKARNPLLCSWLRLEPIPISKIQAGFPKTAQNLLYERTDLIILPQAWNIACLLYTPPTSPTSPPYTRRVEISFDLEADGVRRAHKISAYLRAWAGHLLDDSGEIRERDDD